MAKRTGQECARTTEFNRHLPCHDSMCPMPKKSRRSRALPTNILRSAWKQRNETGPLSPVQGGQQGCATLSDPGVAQTSTGPATALPGLTLTNNSHRSLKPSVDSRSSRLKPTFGSPQGYPVPGSSRWLPAPLRTTGTTNQMAWCLRWRGQPRPPVTRRGNRNHIHRRPSRLFREPEIEPQELHGTRRKPLDQDRIEEPEASPTRGTTTGLDHVHPVTGDSGPVSHRRSQSADGWRKISVRWTAAMHDRRPGVSCPVSRMSLSTRT